MVRPLTALQRRAQEDECMTGIPSLRRTSSAEPWVFLVPREAIFAEMFAIALARN
jgi:hypothetical protein